MTDFSPLDSALYESTPEKIAASLRYLRKADAVMAALMPLSANPQAPPAAAVIDRISDERLRAIHREEQFGLFCDYEEFVSIARHLEALLTRQAPPSAVPEEGLRDSVLNSAKFRASCYALVGIVEGIEGLGRNWAANSERLKDTREWVAFYNCVASMRNGTFNQASAEQAPPAAVTAGYVPVPVEPTEAMLSAARDWSLKKYGQAVGNDGARGCYAAMLAAARKGE